MPAVNTAIVRGVKIFKADLAVKRITSKVNRLDGELESAQDALSAAQDKAAMLRRGVSGDDLQIAEAVRSAYFAD
jgi:outer membrane murein-binding lipoprotein Lpp